MEFTEDHARRVVITGNSGSGKSRLAQRIAQVFSIPVIDLDEIYWMGGGYALKRDEHAARELLEQAAPQSAWVIEGVFGALCGAAVPYATALIWLDLPWEESCAGLMARGLRRGMIESDHASLVAWAAEYWTRQNANSYVGHLKLFEAFGGAKTRLTNRAQVDQFTARWGNQAPPARLDPPRPGS